MANGGIRLGTAALALVAVSAAGCGTESDDEPNRAPTALPAGALTVEHAQDPHLFRTGDGLTLVASSTPGDGRVGGELVTATYDGERWSEVTPLSRTADAGYLAGVDLNPDGVGVVVWVRGTDSADTAVGRIRRPDGTWSPTERLGDIAYVEDVQVNDRGDVAVLGYDEESSRILALHAADGTWTVSPIGTATSSTMALDDDGGVHVAATDTPRGGGGDLTLTYLPPGGTWTAPEKVDVDGVLAGDPVRILALPDGAEALVVGTVSSRWISTFDTEAYWSTDQQVLRRDDRSAAFTRVWSHDGAGDVLARARGDRVELLWRRLDGGRTIEGAEGPVTAPTREILTGTTLGGEDVPLATYDVAVAADDEHGRAEAGFADGCDEPGWVWRVVGTDDRAGDLTVRTGDKNRTYDPGGATSGGLDGAVACVDGRAPWTARVQDVRRTGSERDGDLQVLDATVVVAPD